MRRGYLLLSLRKNSSIVVPCKTDFVENSANPCDRYQIPRERITEAVSYQRKSGKQECYHASSNDPEMGLVDRLTWVWLYVSMIHAPQNSKPKENPNWPPTQWTGAKNPRSKPIPPYFVRPRVGSRNTYSQNKLQV